MSDKYPQRKANRLHEYDYSLPGYYFITLLTKNRVNFFGNIVGTEMTLSEAGQIALKYWRDIPNHYFNIGLDEHIIMPNHIHGVIIISDKAEIKRTARYAVLTDRAQHIRQNELSTIIKAYKVLTKREIRKDGYSIVFDWHRSFYDHVIRSDESLEKTREYIRNNPLKWHLDKYHYHESGA